MRDAAARRTDDKRDLAPQTTRFATPILVISALAAVLIPGHVGSLSDLLQRATSFGIPVRDAGPRQRMVIGLHVSAQIGLGLGGTAVWSQIPLARQSGAWPLIWAFLVYAPVLGAVASLVGAVYLILASQFVSAYLLLNYASLDPNPNKCFLRLHVRRTGELVIYPVAVDACTLWRIHPDGAPEEAWIQPEPNDLAVRLIEPPIVIP